MAPSKVAVPPTRAPRSADTGLRRVESMTICASRSRLRGKGSGLANHRWVYLRQTRCPGPDVLGSRDRDGAVIRHLGCDVIGGLIVGLAVIARLDNHFSPSLQVCGRLANQGVAFHHRSSMAKVIVR